MIYKGNPIIVSNDKIIISNKDNISLINVNGAKIWDLNIKSNYLQLFQEIRFSLKQRQLFNTYK